MKLLDLFSGAGGAAMGYYQAGFTDIVGVDIKPQKRYPFKFIQADAFDYLRGLIESGEIEEYDLIHASPKCQAHTKAQRIRQNFHSNQVSQIRPLLQLSSKSYIIENVPDAPLVNPIILVGTMFNLMTVRERLFECSFPIIQPIEPLPRPKQVKMGRQVKEGDYIQVVGHFSNVAYARKAMDIDWMTQQELKEAIPPAYTQWIGQQFLTGLK